MIVVNMTLLGNLFQLQQIDKWYKNATFTNAFEFKFANEEIKLVLEKEQMKDDWTIFPRNHPCTVGNCFTIIPIWLHWLVQIAY